MADLNWRTMLVWHYLGKLIFGIKLLFSSLKRAKYTVFQHARCFRCICSQVQTPSVVKIALSSLHFKMFSPRRVTRAFERLLFLDGLVETRLPTSDERRPSWYWDRATTTAATWLGGGKSFEALKKGRPRWTWRPKRTS